MSVTNTGFTEWGAGVITGLAGTTAQILCPPQNPGTDPRTNMPISVSLDYSESGRNHLAIVVDAAANQAFNLDYQFTPDGGTTWLTGDQVASTTVTVDGGTAGYTQSARLDISVGCQYRIVLYNTSGSALSGAYEWRIYSNNA